MRWIAIITAMFLLTAYFGVKARFAAAQVNVPFSAGTQGSIAEAEVQIPRSDLYSFYLDMYFDPANQPERARVEKLSGSGATSAYGIHVDNGLPIPVRLRIDRLDNGEAFLILNKDYVDEGLRGFAQDYFSRIITSHHLDPGRYRVRVEALRTIPELGDVTIHFDMHVRPVK